ncbi:hypothetical protein [Streptomyces spiramyceticus]|uniref:hypothetical protein n=1 Tax=Streptomyces spiramyceticus TaxID=299717 RepID=UPI00237C2B7C|nr:hypothetical protein [Streptomyces spiramyceticus]
MSARGMSGISGYYRGSLEGNAAAAYDHALCEAILEVEQEEKFGGVSVRHRAAAIYHQDQLAGPSAFTREPERHFYALIEIGMLEELPGGYFRLTESGRVMLDRFRRDHIEMKERYRRAFAPV